MKSLNLKLTLLFYLSVFVIVTVVFTFKEYAAYDRSNNTATQLLEIGPGYINGATLNDLEVQAQNKGEIIYDVFVERLSGWSARTILATFNPVVDFTTPGGLSGNTSIISMPELRRSGDDYYLLEDTSSKIGPLLISDNFFPLTITSFKDGPPWRRLYYAPVAGYDDLVIVASMDIRFLPQRDWLGKVPGDVILVMPIALVAAFLLGTVITRVTVNPLIKLTELSEKLAAGDLNERTNVKSKDEIGRLGDSLNHMAGEIQESFESQKRFVSDAAHELRTPLASLKASVTKALSAERSNEEYRQLLSFVLLRTNTLEDLINDLLFLARADEGRLKLGEEIFDLSPVLTETVDSFKYLFEDKGISFAGIVEPGILVKGDPKLYMRVFSNLLDNASKYTPAGGIVTLKAGHKDGGVEITVTDTGIGMSEEHRLHAFDRFYNAPDKPNSEHSFGLGLSIAKSIVHAYKGEISVTSSIGKGSVFSVTFPEMNQTSG